MSKSIGNVIEPRAFIPTAEGSTPAPIPTPAAPDPSSHRRKGRRQGKGAQAPQAAAPGADFLRLWAASTDYTADANLGPGVLAKVHDVYRKVRGTARFLLGCLDDWRGGEHCVSPAQMLGVDRHMLRVCRQFARQVTDEYAAGRYARVYALLVHFTAVDLSAFYCDLSKDRLYADAATGRSRRACQTVLASLLETLTKAIAPILPHTAEDVYQHMSPELQRRMDDPFGPDVPIAELNSLFTHGWLSVLSPQSALSQQVEWESPEAVEESARYEAVLRLRGEVNRLLEFARHAKKREEADSSVEVQGTATMGASEADVHLSLALEGRLLEALQRLEAGELEMILGVAMVTLGSGEQPGVEQEMGKEVEGLRVRGEVEVANQDGVMEGVAVTITRTAGVKCNRCWRFTKSARDDCLCARCMRVLGEQGSAAAGTI